MAPWRPCFPGGGWCGPQGQARCHFYCGRSRPAQERNRTDLRDRLGGKGRGYGDDLKQAVEFAVKAGVEAAVKATGEAAMKATGEKGVRYQKPRWEKERDKRILAETKLQEMENIKKVDTL